MTSRDLGHASAGNASARSCILTATLSCLILESGRVAVVKNFREMKEAEIYDCGLFLSCKGVLGLC